MQLENWPGGITMSVTKEEVEEAKAAYEEQYRAAMAVVSAATDKHWDKYWELKKEYEANESGE